MVLGFLFSQPLTNGPEAVFLLSETVQPGHKLVNCCLRFADHGKNCESDMAWFGSGCQTGLCANGKKTRTDFLLSGSITFPLESGVLDTEKRQSVLY